jgi:hypothetical protein
MALINDTPNPPVDNSELKKKRKRGAPMVGRRFGRLLAVGIDRVEGTHRWLLCACDCGNEIVAQASNLCSGQTRSCGCLNSERRRDSSTKVHKHDMCDTRVYRIWCGMRQRCQNPNSPVWEYYGGRGINVCDRWDRFENFLADMGNPANNLTIERIDVNGNYEPSNCRWATYIEQGKNKRNNVILEFDGRRQTVSDWARELGMSPQALNHRLKAGWSVEEALTKPIARNSSPCRALVNGGAE